MTAFARLRTYNTILLCLFVFVLPFERAIPFLPGLSLPKAVGLVYAASLFLNPVFLKSAMTGKVHVGLLALAAVFLFTNILNGGLFNSARLKSIDQSFLLNLIFGFFLVVHNKINPGVLLKAFSYFALGYLCLVAAYHLGFYQTLSNGRVYMGAALPNALGLGGAAAVVSLVSSHGTLGSRSLRESIFVLVGCVAVLSLLLATGSRSALLAVAAILLIYIAQSSNLNRIPLILVGTVLGALFFDSFNVITERTISSVENQELGGRLITWLLIFDIIGEHFWTGVGRNGYDAITEFKIGYSPSPHNVFLEVWVYGGFIALFFLLCLTYILLRASYRALTQLDLRVPIMLLPFIFLVSISGQVFNNTLMFFLFALILSVDKQPRRSKKF